MGMFSSATAFDAGSVVCTGRSGCAACSLVKRRVKSDTAVFSFTRLGVVPCLVLARREEDVYLMLRLRPNGPDSSGCRVFFAELARVSSEHDKGCEIRDTYSAYL